MEDNSKEDILRKWSNLGDMHWQGKAMDEWAMIESVGFAEWMAIRGYKRSDWYHDRWYIPATPQIVETNQPSTTELYQLYQQNKKLNV